MKPDSADLHNTPPGRRIPGLGGYVLGSREVFSKPRRRGFGQYSNTVKNFFDYVENWIKERF